MSSPTPRASAGADWHEAPSLAVGARREGYLVLEREGHLWAVAGTSVRRLARHRPEDGEAWDAEAGGGEAGLEGPLDGGPRENGAGRRREGSMRLTVAGGDLTAHRVLAMVPDLEVTPVPGSLLRFWPEAASGLAVYDGRPLVVIDPQRPPQPLLRDGPEED